jgi:hypothetical protein
MNTKEPRKQADDDQLVGAGEVRVISRASSSTRAAMDLAEIIWSMT